MTPALSLLPTPERPAAIERYHPDDVRAVMDANRPKLIAIAERVALNLANSRKVADDRRR